MSIQLKFKDDRLIKALKRLSVRFPEVEKAIRIEVAGEAVSAIKFKFVPTISRNLQSTVRVVVRGRRVFAVAGGIQGKGRPSKFVNYAKFVNDGTSKIVPRRFMQKGAAYATRDVQSLANKTLRGWLRELK